MPLKYVKKTPARLKQNKFGHYVLTKATIDTTIKIDKDNIAYELMKRRVAVIKTSIIIKFEIIK